MNDITSSNVAFYIAVHGVYYEYTQSQTHLKPLLNLSMKNLRQIVVSLLG